MCLFKLSRSTFQQRIAKKDRNYDRNYGPKFQSLIQKQSLTVVPPLREVIRPIRQNDSGFSWHMGILQSCLFAVKVSLETRACPWFLRPWFLLLYQWQRQCIQQVFCGHRPHRIPPVFAVTGTSQQPLPNAVEKTQKQGIQTLI